MTKDKSKSYPFTRHDAPQEMFEGREPFDQDKETSFIIAKVGKPDNISWTKEVKAKNQAVKDYCEDAEFVTHTDDPKATIYNLRAMAFASGWEAAQYYYGLITRPIPIAGNMEVRCHNCNSVWTTSEDNKEFKCLKCGSSVQPRIL